MLGWSRQLVIGGVGLLGRAAEEEADVGLVFGFEEEIDVIARFDSGLALGGEQFGASDDEDRRGVVGELDLGERGAADGDGGVDVVGADLAAEVLDGVHLDGG